MKHGFSKLACCVVLGGAVGFVLGYLVPTSRTSTSARTHSSNWTSFEPQPGLPDFMGAFGETTDEQSPEPVYFPDHMQTPEGAVSAHGMSMLVDADATDPANSEPGTLPAGREASPITAGQPEDDELQELLDAELADVSDEDRQVWLDVLRGLPPEDALGILKLWKRFGTRSGDSPSSLIGSARPFLEPSSAKPLTTLDNQTSHTGAGRLVRQLQAARSVLIGNLTHAWSPGHQRIEPILFSPSSLSPEDEDVPPLAVSAVDQLDDPHAPIAKRIDLTPGELRYTARPLDVAIGGMGFFIVEREGQTLFTRTGRLALDEQRRLILADQRLPCLLHPEIVIPETATQITIDQYGAVAVADRDADGKVVIGQINLALFLDPTALTPLDGPLYAPNSDSGPAWIDRPSRDNRGLLSQFHLEAANISFDSELRRIRQIDELIELHTGGNPTE